MQENLTPVLSSTNHENLPLNLHAANASPTTEMNLPIIGDQKNLDIQDMAIGKGLGL